MSLINDALRRARQAQQDSPSSNLPPVTQFRPVEPSVQPVRHGVGVMLPIVFGTIALLALLLLWELSRRSPIAPSQSTTAIPVAARAVPAEQPVAANVEPTPAPAVSAPGGSIPVAKATEEKTAEPVVNAPDRTALASSPVPVTNATAVPEPAATNHVVATEPQPVPLKLQSIVFSPRRPSAMINGRVVFIGDRIREFKVAAIHAGDVVLAGAGRTNLLSLEP